MPVLEMNMQICNIKGLHARAAAKFVSCVNNYDCDVLVSKDGSEVPGSSIMGLMMLAASKGTEIFVRADGPDASAALQALSELVAERFHEEV